VAAELQLKISELFYSIQGESTWAGMPCIFIRLSGCNLRCNYCDATYTYEEEGQDYPLQEILAYCEKHPHAIVEITGGEPLLQENIYPLLDSLLHAGRTVLIETNGSLPMDKIPENVIKIMDLKCPDSGMHEKNDLGNLQGLTCQDNLKFVLSSKRDFDWAVDLLRQYLPKIRAGNNVPDILFSPVPGRMAAQDLADWILKENLPIRLQIQLHKILWPKEQRGV